MNLIIKLVIYIVALIVVEYVIPGFEFVDMQATVVSAVIIGAINTFIRPIIHVISLPISIMTLGIFAFLINVFLLWFVAYLVPGFNIDGFVTAAVASIVLALISAFLNKLARE